MTSLFLCLLGYTRQYSKLTFDSTLIGLFWQCLKDHMLKKQCLLSVLTLSMEFVKHKNHQIDTSYHRNYYLVYNYYIM